MRSCFELFFSYWYEYNEVYDLITSSPDFKVVEKEPSKNISFITCIENQNDFSDIFKELEDSMLFRELINKFATIPKFKLEKGRLSLQKYRRWL